MVRCFENDNIVHVDGRVNPVADKEIIDTELQLKDLESIEKKISRVERAAKSGDVKMKKELAVLQQFRDTLLAGKNARTITIGEEDRSAVADLATCSRPSRLFMSRMLMRDRFTPATLLSMRLRHMSRTKMPKWLMISAAIEAQIAELESAEDREVFLQEYGLTESGLNKLLRASYHLLDLITYFTAGEKEVRAWTIKKGWKAPQAAGVIHTDFEKGFIRAEVIKLADYQQYKTEQACKEAGKMSVEGKEYVVARRRHHAFPF